MTEANCDKHLTRNSGQNPLRTSLLLNEFSQSFIQLSSGKKSPTHQQIKNRLRKRNASGYIPFNAMLAIIGIAFTVLLITTSQSMRAFHNTATHVTNWQTAALAGATITAQESGRFLDLLQKSLLTSLDQTNKNGFWNEYISQSCKRNDPVLDSKGRPVLDRHGNPVTQEVSYDCSYNNPRNDAYVWDGDNEKTSNDENQRESRNTERLNLVSNFINAKIPELIRDGNYLHKNLQYAIEIGPSVRHRSFKIKELISTDFVPPKSPNPLFEFFAMDGSRKLPSAHKLASTLITSKIPRNIVLPSQYFFSPSSSPYLSNYYSGDKIVISERLLRSMVGNHPSYQYLIEKPGKFGLDVVQTTGQGLDLTTIPTGITLEIETNIPAVRDEKISQSEQGYDPSKNFLKVIHSSTAQMRFESFKIPPVVECPDGTIVNSPDECPTPDPQCVVNGETITVSKSQGFCHDAPFSPNCPCFCSVNPGNPECKDKNSESTGSPTSAPECTGNEPQVCADGKPPSQNLNFMIEPLNTNLFQIAYDKDSAEPPGSELNPIYIIRKGKNEDDVQKGFYTAVYQDGDGNIHYQHGSKFWIDKNGNYGFKGEGIISELDRYNETTTDAEGNTVFVPLTFASFDACSETSVTLPIFSRVKRRFGVLSQDITLADGTVMKAGTIVAGLLDEATLNNGEKKNFPGYKGYEEFRFYDPENGSVIGIRKPKDFDQTNGKQIADDIRDFSTENADDEGIYGEGFAGSFDMGGLTIEDETCDYRHKALVFGNILRDLAQKAEDGLADKRDGSGLFTNAVNNKGGTGNDEILKVNGVEDLGPLFDDMNPIIAGIREAKEEARIEFEAAKDKVKDGNQLLSDLEKQLDKAKANGNKANTQSLNDQIDALKKGVGGNLGLNDWKNIKDTNEKVFQCNLDNFNNMLSGKTQSPTLCGDIITEDQVKAEKNPSTPKRTLGDLYKEGLL